MRQSLRYLVAATALGGIGYAGSEALFWSFPPADITVRSWAETIVAYALAGACGLSAVIWTGLGGWRGVFLGAAIMGFVVEGVIVSTMYDAFPFQLVWTPLAWHALVTGLLLPGLCLLTGRGSLWCQIAAMTGVGAFLALFAGYWPTVHHDLPEPGAIFLYQIASGLAGLAGLLILNRMGALPRPPRPVLLVVPVMALALWLLQGVADPRPQRLAWPVMVGATLWAMRRLGSGAVVSFGPPLPAERLLPLMLPHLLVAAVCAYFLRGNAGFEGNIVAALTLGPAGLALWLFLLWQAFRQPSAARPTVR